MAGSLNPAEDIEAIERYLGSQIPRTNAAKAIRDDFLRYMSTLSWLDRRSNGVYDVVRNFRIRYDKANVTSAAEQHAVDLQARGLSSEQMMGEPDRRLSTGEYAPRSGAINPGNWLPLAAIAGFLWFITRGQK